MLHRLLLLYIGLVLYGPAAALLVRARLGLDPWNVLHQGIADRAPISFGSVVILLSGVVLLIWIPLRQRPGLGTISNAIVVGLSMDVALANFPDLNGWLPRIGSLFLGVVLIGVATAMYIGAGFGSGPRDGLMTGIAARTGWSLRSVRTGIELSVVAAGWSLGGQLGLGTLLFAVSIGPLIQGMLPYFEAFGRVHPIEPVTAPEV